MSNGYSPKSEAPVPLAPPPKAPGGPRVPPMAGGQTYRQQLVLALAPVVAVHYSPAGYSACADAVSRLADAIIKKERETA